MKVEAGMRDLDHLDYSNSEEAMEWREKQKMKQRRKGTENFPRKQAGKGPENLRRKQGRNPSTLLTWIQCKEWWSTPCRVSISKTKKKEL